MIMGDLHYSEVSLVGFDFKPSGKVRFKVYSLANRVSRTKKGSLNAGKVCIFNSENLVDHT